MSTAKLNIWVTERAKPCSIPSDPNHVRYVHVLHCDGTPLVWCDRKFVNIETKCGHVELEVPPGCYVVGAAEGKASSEKHLGNHLTHVAIVQVKCGDHACVTLFDPTFSYCGHWFLTAIRNNADLLPREAQATAQNAAQAVEALLRTLPPDDFTTQQARSLEAEAPRVTATKKPGGAKGGTKK